MFLHVFSCFRAVSMHFSVFYALGALLAAPGTLPRRSWDDLKRSWDAFGPAMGRFWPLLKTLGMLLGRSESHVGPTLQKMCPKSGEQNGCTNHQKSMSKATAFADSFFKMFFSNFHRFLDLKIDALFENLG